MKSFSIVLSITIIMLCSACSRENSNYVEPEFQPYVDLFFEEANKRNLDISPDDFSFSVIYGDDYPRGACFTRSSRVEINKFYWNSLTELTKQGLIFHELGHCLLERPHDNEVLPNGECKSIMKGDEENECRFNIDNFKSWNTYYLDELFDKDVALPDWYTSEIEIIPQTVIFEMKDSLAKKIHVDIGEIDSLTNLHIEAVFEDWDKSNRIALRLDDERIICSENGANISNIRNILRYFKKDVAVGTDTKVDFVRKDGFYYYLINDKMFHIEDERGLPLRNISLEMIPGSSFELSETLLSLKISVIE